LRRPYPFDDPVQVLRVEAGMDGEGKDLSRHALGDGEGVVIAEIPVQRLLVHRDRVVDSRLHFQLGQFPLQLVSSRGDLQRVLVVDVLVAGLFARGHDAGHA
jgi:hypothetical protein